MKFSINKTELQNAISIVLKGTSTRTTLPVLSGILIDAHANGLTLQATDLESSIQFEVAALVEEEGKTVVPGKLFNDIVKNLPDAAVRIQQKENEAHITCETSSFSVKTMNAEDFPAFPHVETNQSIEIPFPQFANMVSTVARAVSHDESRAILTGVLITVEANKLRMVATDSYRLALAQTETTAAEDFEAVISGSFLQEIASLPKTEEPVKIALAENQIVVTCDKTIFVNRRIEGTYPNYKQLIPDSFTTRTEVNLSALTASVKRASLMTSVTSPLRIDINIASQTLLIDAVHIDVGTVQETIPCAIQGEDMQIAFNSNYVIDGLTSLNCEKIYFDVQNPTRPGILRTVDDDSLLYLIMPVKL